MSKKDIDAYFDLITKDKEIKKVSDETIDYYFNELLKILPNKGKLYKYRSFQNKSFKKMVDSFKHGYLYVPLAKDLNDRLDTTIVYKMNVTTQDIEKYYYDNRYSIFKFFYKSQESIDPIRTQIVDSLSKGEDQTKIILSVANLIKRNKIRAIPNIVQFIKEVKNEALILVDKIKDTAINSFENMDINFKQQFRVFSMSELYNQDSMWAYYSNDNNGYCVEYDFNKAKNFGRDIKEKLISMGKITYSDKKEIIDLFNIYDVSYEIDNTDESFVKCNREITRNFFTKRKSWSHEKEWRLFLNIKDPKLYADIISGIIIDQSAFEKSGAKAKRLVRIAKKHNWNLRIRMYDRIKCDYKYIPYKRYLKCTLNKTT